jgi:hypothetical protein
MAMHVYIYRGVSGCERRSRGGVLPVIGSRVETGRGVECVSTLQHTLLLYPYDMQHTLLLLSPPDTLLSRSREVLPVIGRQEYV